ncbi:filamentous hemagglutinin N-terminal domain-containing protein [Nostoc sp. FACHB-110]|uniref:two-partner secretion domain-containing protein n=1 Tax=Nostoc sp. FACHB-110 TaxID=2692834 RepID=UPI001685F491|nr:filamentous hemagglutinin N-terminal domain-containing protein [Nostoc sp. FACHB-110]MBD2435493.1 filamentous hemagglutinin N-terminal domain-containing protein [Nostoc sp. FACHB-110]
MKINVAGLGLISAIVMSAICHSDVHAQVTSDGTLNTSVTGSNHYTITNGDRVGNNLFHSFSQFSIPTNGSASFDNATDIENIFSRVTGGNISHIDGAINANGSANLFLLNPAGIIFGQNASLNIGGSFIGTTANSIKFADGTEFSAVQSAGKPLLTMSVPVGLQIGQNSGGITVEGLGHRLITGSFTPLDRSQNPTGLQVKSGNTVALIGNQVKFSGGIVAVNGGGHLELGSVQQGQVGLDPTLTGWVGDYSQIQQFNDIHLAQKSMLDASGNNGSIQVQGKNISLSEGSTLLLQNLGAQSQGITVHATESLNLTGNAPQQGLSSAIRIENLGIGSSGDVVVFANQLSMQDGARINNLNFTTAIGGNIKVDVKDFININGFISAVPSETSVIGTVATNSGKAGDINISSGNLRITSGGNVNSVTAGSGESGAILINTTGLIEVTGNNPFVLAPSGISSTTFSTGNANSILVNTSRLIASDGGSLGSGTLNRGLAGNVTINASEFVEVRGKAPGSIRGSNIASSSEILDPILQATFKLPPIPSGDAGALTINTPSLRVTNGAFVSVKNDGPGKAGDLQINANSLLLNNQGNISASTASGNGGDVRLNLQEYLLMRYDSVISATSLGKGNGGNVSIKSPVIVGLENSDIIANAVQGRGGNIDITTQSVNGLVFRNTLTPRVDLSNDITASSQFNVNGTVQINNIGIDLNSALVELPTNITDSSQQIATGCADTSGSSFVATGRGGIPQNPTQGLRSEQPWSDTRDISAFYTTQPVKAQISKSPVTLVQATSWRRNAQGKVELVTDNSSTQKQTSLTCAAVPR